MSFRKAECPCGFKGKNVALRAVTVDRDEIVCEFSHLESLPKIPVLFSTCRCYKGDPFLIGKAKQRQLKFFENWRAK